MRTKVDVKLKYDNQGPCDGLVTATRTFIQTKAIMDRMSLCLAVGR